MAIRQAQRDVISSGRGVARSLEGLQPSPSAVHPPVVCHLIASNFAGGPEKQILEHCALLESHGWQVVVGSFRENRSQVEVTEAARALRLPAFLIDTRSQFSLIAVLQLRRQLVDRGIQVLITHGYKSDVVGYLACRGVDCVQVPFVRGFTGESWRVRRYEELDRWVLRRFRRVLCVSEGTRRILIGHGLAPDHVTAIHNAIDTTLAAGITPVDLRVEFDIPASARILVAAGRLSPEKGHRVLVAALAELATLEPPVHLVLLGSGVEEENLRRQASAAGLAGRVVFAGFRRDVLRYLAGADLVVNPSFTEGLPNVLLEAFALGRPVVATDVGGTSELVQPGNTGWLAPAGDPARLASTIREALHDPARATRFATNARELVSRSFTFTQQAERLIQVYEEALCLHPTAPPVTEPRPTPPVVERGNGNGTRP
jgi:glycosyltransferase involved in cell wall biosynthesis